jgi:Phytanoyl-CoA dioxygenase (PhyH)
MCEKAQAIDTDYFRTFGFLVLRQFFDPGPLAPEIDEVLEEGLASASDVSRYDGIQFQYVPMMTARTPASLSLLDQTEAVAATLLGGSVLPTRAKAVRYFGNTPWHVDSKLQLASIGFAAYLEPTAAETGSLRVLPGSHNAELNAAIRKMGGMGLSAPSLPSYSIATEPGDVIAFDEHLFHSSFGGGVRRQWRLDYLRTPQSPEEERETVAYFAGLYPPDWDAAYDVDRYPSYGSDWRASGRSCVGRLEALGVYELAARQEAQMRKKRILSKER